MLAQNRDIAIFGGNFVANAGNTAFEKLQNASAPNAFHDSIARFDPPKCHPNTRFAVIEYLMGWIFGRNDPEALILWLYGPAGAGKSAILQTIAERCVERKALLASFFFGRSDSTRNNFKPLIATIAYQIATAIPEIKPAIESVIERDPLLFSRSIATQLQCLIVEPLKELAATGFFNDPVNCARLILIDGLDECDDPKMQSMILRAIANALRDQKFHLIFLIASRPEQHLTLTFNSVSLVGLWRSLVLDNSFEPDDDIRLFLEDSFEEIKSTHPHHHLIPAVWPESSDVYKLVQKSSGQFIYASVVIKYISMPNERPHHQLEVVMDLRPARRDVPFAELDALYIHLLSSCPDPETVLLALGVSTCYDIRVWGSISVMEIELLADLQPGDVEIALSPLTSIINLSVDEFREKYIRLSHASFTDFLFDVSRSGQFHINTATYDELIVCNCLTKLTDPYECFRRYPDQVHMLSFTFLMHPLLYLGVIPFNETIKNALKAFSLPQVWSNWSSTLEPWHSYSSFRAHSIARVLKYLSNRVETKECKQIYDFHLSSFESLFKSEIQPYLQDVGLLSLLVVTLLDNNFHMVSGYDFGLKNRNILFRLTEEAIKYNDDTFALDTNFLNSPYLPIYYRRLFTGPTAPAELRLDGHKHAQAALRILEFLCDHPPHPIPYRKPSRKNRFPKSHSARSAASSQLSRHFLRGILPIQRLSDISFPRKRREEKHRHGVALSFRLPRQSTEDPDIVRGACAYRLAYLPAILEQSSKSPDLVDFIRMHAKDIVFIPQWTQQAIRAMHEYLDRPEEDAVMVDLREKFEAMVIE